MGNHFSRKTANKLLDEDYDDTGGSFFFFCSPCIMKNCKINKWKRHFKEQCLILRKYHVFWAEALLQLLGNFPETTPQEKFQRELSSPRNIQWVEDQLFLAKNSAFPTKSYPNTLKPELSINNLYTNSDDDDNFEANGDSVEEIQRETPKLFSDEFEICDAESLANGILNLERIRDSAGKKLHIRSYSNNLLLSRQWESVISVEKEREIVNSLKYYQWATTIIELHMNDAENALCFLKNSFKKLFTERYVEKLKLLRGKRGKTEEFEAIHSDSVHELSQFIRVLQESLALFYDLDAIGNKFSGKFCLFTKDNLKNFTTSLILNDELYYLIFALHKRMYHPHARKFRRNFSVFSAYDPEKFGVPPSLCLNQTTIEFFRQKRAEVQFSKTKSPRNLQKFSQNPLVFEIGNGLFRSFCENEAEDENHGNSGLRSLSESKQIHEKTHSKFKKSSWEEIKENFSNNLDIYHEKPYEPAIETLKNIVFYKSPVHKLKIVLKTLEKIEKCIRQFYEKFNGNYEKVLAGDEITTIFLYVISKCNVPNLFAHLKFIENFATPNILNSKAGYYNATLQVCVSHLEDIQGVAAEIDEKERESLFSQSVRSCLLEVQKKTNNFS